MRERDSSVQEIQDSDENAETFFASRLPSIVRAFTLPLSPGMMRVTTLNALFDRSTCGSLHRTLLLCLGTVELTRGREMVFSNNVLTELGQQGSRDLWEQRSYQDSESRSGLSSSSTFDINSLPVAEAVAASSAFPPFFPPVVIRRGTSTRRLVGVFSDGGVIDNAALHAPIDMMIFCSQNWIRYAKPVGYEFIRPSSFEEIISDIFVIDAGAPATQVKGASAIWPPIKVMHRIIDIMQGSQGANVNQKLGLMNSTDPKYTAIKIDESLFPWEDGSRDMEIPSYIARIRTHFDAFDPVETAALVYSGYCQADLAFGDKAQASKPLRSFLDVAREVTGTETVGKMSKQEIVCHLSFSHLRWNWWRKIRRVVGL